MVYEEGILLLEAGMEPSVGGVRGGRDGRSGRDGHGGRDGYDEHDGRDCHNGIGGVSGIGGIGRNGAGRIGRGGTPDRALDHPADPADRPADRASDRAGSGRGAPPGGPAPEPCDLVTVPTRQGLEAVDILRRTAAPAVGPVLHDNACDTLGFLVPPGTADGWDVPGSACTETAGPDGGGWLLPPEGAEKVTDPEVLREALGEAARLIEVVDRCS